MESSMMKNIVVLKNLPSNLVEEAFVILKENERIPIENLVKSDGVKENGDKTFNYSKENDKDYIIKEAEMHIANYINNIEKKENETETKILKLKYKKSKILNYCLIFVTAISLIKNFI